MNLLLAPVLALFSLRFYRLMSKSSLRKGFLYLAYLAFISTVFIFVWVLVPLMPKADQFVEWVKNDMPSLVLTKEGMTMNELSPYVLSYPGNGTVAVFDMTKANVTSEEMGTIPIYVTSKKIFFNDKQKGEMKVIDLAARVQTQKNEKPFQINRETIRRFYSKAKPLIIGLICVVLPFLFFIVNLLKGLAASLIGLIFNAFRKSKLPYNQILNVSFFALTASFWVGILTWMVPGFRIPYGLLVHLLVTGLYLLIGIKLTESKEPE